MPSIPTAPGAAPTTKRAFAPASPSVRRADSAARCRRRPRRRRTFAPAAPTISATTSTCCVSAASRRSSTCATGCAPPEADHVRERYLRVHLVDGGAHGDHPGGGHGARPRADGWLLRELPRPGVYDAKLAQAHARGGRSRRGERHRAPRLRARRQAIPTAHGGEYTERYGVEPALVNFLFYAQPARTSATILLPRTA